MNIAIALVGITFIVGCGSPPPHVDRVANDLPAIEPDAEVPADRVVSLEDVAGPRAPSWGTFITGREAPADGVRARRGGVAVMTRDGLDYLVDADGGELIAAIHDDRERLALGGDGFTGDVERIIWIAAVTDRRVSVYLGHSFYTAGAAHANNDLACVTFDRATRRRLEVRDLDPRRADDTSTGFLLDDDPGQIHLCTPTFDSVVELRAIRIAP